jgi:hypothetical protein
MMAAVPAGSPVPQPADSLEVRWLFPGLLETAVREWFARFPAEIEVREDAYLLQPDLGPARAWITPALTLSS